MSKMMKRVQHAFWALLLLSVAPFVASEAHLKIIDGNKQITLPIEALRQQADVEFFLYAPFRGREIQVRGYLLEALLAEHLGRVPSKIKLSASDGYSEVFYHWQPDHWFVVTHEDGKPLSLRQQGPLRLVERDSERDISSLNNFNDWVWMLQNIQTMP